MLEGFVMLWDLAAIFAYIALMVMGKRKVTCLRGDQRPCLS